MIAEVDAELRAELELADAAPGIQPWELLEHVFATPTPEMREQQAELRALHAGGLHPGGLHPGGRA